MPSACCWVRLLVLNEAPIPDAVPTRPCARLKRLVPFVTSAMTQCRQHADHCPAGAVQQLKCKEYSRIGDQREQQRTDGQSPLSKEQERPPTPVVGLTSNPGSHRGNNNQWQDFNADTMREERLFLPDISVTLRQAAILTRCRVGTRTSRRQGQASRNLPQSRAVGSRGPVAHVVMGISAGATEVNIGGVDASESEKERQSERDDRRNIAWYEKAYPEVTSTLPANLYQIQPYHRHRKSYRASISPTTSPTFLREQHQQERSWSSSASF
jgi:hypothetical protein